MAYFCGVKTFIDHHAAHFYFIHSPQNRLIMEIRQLKYFVGVAEAGSISEASRRFYLSQSAISQQIKALEDELDTALFIRTSHHLSLTESGEMLLPLARQVVKSVNDCTERMADLNDMLCGELRVGLTFSLEPYVRPVIVRFLKAFPKVRLSVYYKSIPELREMLHAHSVDMILSVDHGDVSDDSINAERVMDYKLCAIMRDTHPLASRPLLNFQDMALQHFVLPEAGIRDRNAGIWKDITFFATDTVRLDAPYVRTKLFKALPDAVLPTAQPS